MSPAKFVNLDIDLTNIPCFNKPAEEHTPAAFVLIAQK